MHGKVVAYMACGDNQCRRLILVPYDCLTMAYCLSLNLGVTAIVLVCDNVDEWKWEVPGLRTEVGQ